MTKDETGMTDMELAISIKIFFLFFAIFLFISSLTLHRSEPEWASMDFTMTIVCLLGALLSYVLEISIKKEELNKNLATDSAEKIHEDIEDNSYEQTNITIKPAVKYKQKHALFAECPNCGASISQNMKQCAYCDSYLWT